MAKSLDDGVMKKPTKAFTGNRTGKSLDFEDMIARGDNPRGQMSISPAECTNAGESIGYGQQPWRAGTDGHWNDNPMLDAGRGEFSWPAVPVMGVSKKKKK